MTKINAASLGRHAAALLLATTAGACASSWPSQPVKVTEVLHLDGATGSMSEGLAVQGKTAYLGYAGSGQVVSVDLDSGAVAPYASLPQPVAGKGFVSGLATRGDELFGALVSFVPDVQAGVYRIATGAPATLYAKHAEMVFPNGMAFDDAGRMYVTDSAAGAVFRVSPAGEVVKWAADPLLTGAKDSCGPGKGVGVPFDIGANGIVVEDHQVFVTNTDRATIVRIAIDASGAAGAATVFAGPDCDALGGADGLAVAPDGDLIVADNHLDKLVRVDGTGHVSTLVASDPLDFPTSLVFANGALYISNFAFLDAKRPGVLRIK